MNTIDVSDVQIFGDIVVITFCNNDGEDIMQINISKEDAKLIYDKTKNK